MWKKIKLLLIILILPILLSLPSLTYLFDNTLVLFPNPRYNSRIGASVSQNSSIEDFYFDAGQLSISFILRDKPEGEYPFCSLAFWLKGEDTFLNLSGYDYLILEIEKATPKNMVIFIKTFVNGISKPEKVEAHTLRHNEYTLAFKPDVSRYKINIRDFYTQEWWFDMMQVPDDKRGKETYTQVAALDFQFIHRENTPLAAEKETFIATRIALHKTCPVFFIILNIIALLYLFLVGGSVTRKRRMTRLLKAYSKVPYKEIQHKPLELKGHAEHELTIIRQYLEEHYNDPEISSSLIARETGISRSHIMELIKKEYNSTCKQIINQIRITEAKRLLRTTDRRILEIALEVGFNDISTFNRCFKKAEGTTPRQYRCC